MRIFIALFTFFSLVLAIKVGPTQTPDDWPPAESSGNGHLPTTGSIGFTAVTHTLSTIIPSMTPVPAKNGSTNPDDTDPSPSCNSGSVHCCETIYPSNSLMGRDLAHRLSENSARQLLDFGSIGFQCTPFALGGTSSNQCNSQVVCCTENDFSALIAFGCNNINIVL